MQLDRNQLYRERDLPGVRRTLEHLAYHRLPFANPSMGFVLVVNHKGTGNPAGPCSIVTRVVKMISERKQSSYRKSEESQFGPCGSRNESIHVRKVCCRTLI